MANREPIDSATAIVLAGGRSSRMGQPKALLPFDQEPLIAHIVSSLKELFADVVVIIAPGEQLPALPATLVRDEVAYQGPVSGIYHGLNAAQSELGFVASCDVPFLNQSLISYVCSQSRDHDVVVPYWADRFQPLFAVYRKSVAPYLQAQLQRGELRPIFLFDKSLSGDESLPFRVSSLGFRVNSKLKTRNLRLRSDRRNKPCRLMRPVAS
jgi:molybdopterin-guanine dinucleotide biosynthesis protein A